MKRAVICVENPQDYISKITDYSQMIINPLANADRNQYLLDHSDWSLLITDQGEQYRNGGDYDEAVFLYTSGTTGDSKFYSFTQSQLDIVIDNVISEYNLTANDIYASLMPLWHPYGQTFYRVAKKVNCEVHHYSIKNWSESPKCNPTFIASAPVFLKTLAKFDFTNLDFIISAGGAFANINEYNEFKNKFNSIILESYGLTESLGHCFTNPRYGEHRYGTIGLPFGLEAKIDQDNHLHLHGPACAMPGWFDTGDLAQQDDKGYYKLLGRSDDIIRTKGVNINPLSIEKQLRENIPGLVECAIFGTDRINCVYVGDATPDQIQKFLLGLGSHCRAKNIVKMDALPLNVSGKISRYYLNNLFKS